MTTRVHILAKELSVTSKAILEKCRAEGLDVKNHMAVISAGLEQTIREWFSEGAAKTAVEETEHVDLTKARRRPRKKAKEGEEGVAEAATAVEAPVAEPVAPVEEPVAPAAEPVAEVETAVAPPAVEPVPEPTVALAEPPAAPAPVAVEHGAPNAPVAELAAPAAPAVAAQAASPAGAHKAPHAPAKPKMIAGPQNVPAPAQMKGPRVVRVERPEPDSRPRSRAGGPGGPRPGGPAGAGESTTGPARPSRRRGGAAPAEGAVEGESEAAAKKRRGRSPRRSGRSEVTERIREWRDQDLIERQERLALATGRLKTRRSDDGHHLPGAPERPSELVIEVPISIKNLSSTLGIKSSDIIRKLMDAGVMATMNFMLDADNVTLLSTEFGISVHAVAEKTPAEKLAEEFSQMAREHLSPRPPVVTFLGHVDHGKTSLLDRIRHADVVSGESGGITQHIGAYRWEKDGKVVVFLDTPGHQAFTQMRARGANMTDVVVLVVAADDGVMPQTIEAMNHAKAAGVPIVVALNKIDRPDADEHRVLGQLAEQGLSPREWGGTVEVIRTSATTGKGVDQLLELLALEAELLELKADPTLPASGTIIEAKMDTGRGVLARALVQDGTLKVGNVVVCGPAYGRIKAVLNDRGKDIRTAPPGTPVELVGLSEVPEPGEKFYVLKDASRAKELAETRNQTQRESELAKRQAVTLENLFSRISAGETRELPLIIKADVQGSADVLVDQINKLSTAEVKVHILHTAVGGINESDVLLAAASNAIIIGFHVVPDEAARALAAERAVQIRLYKIIYEITDAIHKALEGMLAPEIQEKVLGHAEVRNTFKVSRIGTIAGCQVTDGVLLRNAKYRLSRDGVVIQDALALDSLKRFKDDAREVRSGLECGLKLSGFDDVKVGDHLEAWTTQEVARTLE
ncbi:MAG: translation initiation factor IF-2 [Phycisphaerae bacterium]|nr:translation initiation factor IF-2 [Phycisphaerae bacterium]